MGTHVTHAFSATGQTDDSWGSEGMKSGAWSSQAQFWEGLTQEPQGLEDSFRGKQHRQTGKQG